MLSNRDECPAELLELAALPQVSVRFGQPASFIDADANGWWPPWTAWNSPTTSWSLPPALPPLFSRGRRRSRCLSYSTIDDAASIGEAVKEVTRVVGRRPLGILVGNGPRRARRRPCCGPAESVPSAPPSAPPRVRPGAGRLPVPPAPPPGIVFDDGSSMNGDLVVLAEERAARNGLADSAGLETAADGGIVIGRDFATAVPGIWAIGDAASCDGVRLGLLVASGSAAGACAAQLMQATLQDAVPAAA